MLRVQTEWYITGLSDADLIEYARDGIYGPEAIEFAQAEIKRRNLNPEQIREMEVAADKHIEDRKVDAAASAIRSLGRTGRILAFIGGYCGIIFLPPLLAATCFDNLGHHQKKKDVWAFTFYGFGTSILCVVVVSLVLNAKYWMGLLWPCCCLLSVICILVFPPKTKGIQTCDQSAVATSAPSSTDSPECGAAATPNSEILN